jgi:hypothetical protein
MKSSKYEGEMEADVNQNLKVLGKRPHLGDLSIEGQIILNWIINK